MEFMPDFEVKYPKTVDEAVVLAKQEGAVFLAGGTDLLANLRRGIGDPTIVVDLTKIDELSSISETKDGLRIGAGVTLNQLLSSEHITNDFNVIAEAASTIAGTTHQYSATVGGNLCLDTRCQYYNQSHWWRSANDFCLKYKGDICHVAPKGKVCRAAFSGDLAPAMLLHRAEAELVSIEGSRTIDLADMYQEDGANSLMLLPGELLVAIKITKLQGYKTAYKKMRVRGGVDFPLAGVAMATLGTADKIEDLRIAYTGTNSQPIRLTGLEELNGKSLDENTLKMLRKILFKQIMPMRSTFTPSTYRRKVAVNLTYRLAKELLE